MIKQKNIKHAYLIYMYYVDKAWILNEQEISKHTYNIYVYDVDITKRLDDHTISKHFLLSWTMKIRNT